MGSELGIRCFVLSLFAERNECVWVLGQLADAGTRAYCVANSRFNKDWCCQIRDFDCAVLAGTEGGYANER